MERQDAENLLRRPKVETNDHDSDNDLSKIYDMNSIRGTPIFKVTK